MTGRSCLYVGQVFHRRTRPRVHTLRYRVFSLLVDLDEIDALAASLWPLSRNRPNLFAFHDRDFGEDPGEPLARYVARQLAAAGIDTPPTCILLACCPRVLGYAFNPLSLFYCLDAEDTVFAVVHEVHNTFGERHAYALAVPSVPCGTPSGHGDTAAGGASGGAARGSEQWIRQRADKALFVSPFNPMAMRYEFRLNVPAERQVVVVRALDAEGPVLTASYVASRRPLDTRRLLGLLARMPLTTPKVTAGIHWEALRLWCKGVPLFSHVPKGRG